MDDIAHRRNSKKKAAAAAAGGIVGGAIAVGTLLLLGLIWLVYHFVTTKDQKPQRMVQNITVIRPPPPPPPEEAPPPPPPEKVQEQIQQNPPEPTPDNAPAPSQQLGLDADAGAGDDAFGLAARKGGSDLVGSGGSAFAWYTVKLKDEVTDRLSSDPKLRAKKFTIAVRVWIESDGRIKDVRLANSTGSRDLDGAIASALASIGRLSQAPPLEMPQPITLQIVSRS